MRTALRKLVRSTACFPVAHELVDAGLRGAKAVAFSGWRLSAVLLAKAGTPFDVGSGSDGEGFGNVDGSPGDRPNILDPGLLGRSIAIPTPRRALPTSAFGFIQAVETAGNLGRNTFRKDGIFNVNAPFPGGGRWAATHR